MTDIWFISDTHLNHANILKWDTSSRKNRFESIEHMNETILDNWNSVVKKGDIVYHLGDVFFGPKEDFLKMWPKFNGSKRLILGNHDDAKFMSSGGLFKKILLWRVWHDKPLLFTHIPVHEGSIHERIKEKGGINVHGHIHDKPSPKGPYKCICAEQVNYTPVNLEELL